MSYETVRISELAKELGLQSKEVIEKFAQIGITGKTHSRTVSKPRPGTVEAETKPEETAPIVEEKKPVVEKVSRIEKVERPKVEVVKPVSRLEIVRRAPKKPQVTEVNPLNLEKVKIFQVKNHCSVV